MLPLILDLQQQCIKSNASIEDLLRIVLVIAKKLDLLEYQKWAESELKGYENHKEVPKYRIIKGIPVILTENGVWQEVNIDNLSVEQIDKMSTFYIDYSVEQIERVLINNPPAVVITYDTKTQEMLMNAMSQSLIPAVKVDSIKLKNILNGVKSTILAWTLELERNKVFGKDLFFTEEEKIKANTVKLADILQSI
jgi:hypothetical protein